MVKVGKRAGHGSSFCTYMLGSESAHLLTWSREGAVTVLVGASTFFILPRDPATAKFLNTGERESVLHALARDREFQEEKEDFAWSTCLSALKAPQMWFVFIQFFSSGGKFTHFCNDDMCILS